MPKRMNAPGNRSIATLDNNPDKHFKQLQQAGVIPSQYSNWDEVDLLALDLYSQGLTDDQVGEALGIKERNVIKNRIIQLNESSGGKFRGINKRALREDIKPDEAQFIRQQFGETFLDDVKRLRELEWGDKRPRKGEDVEALKERIYSAMDGGKYQRSITDPDFESAKVEADRARDRLHSAFGNGGRGAQAHRGHGFSALDGAGVGSTNLVAEWGPGNVGHGSAPRFDKRVMRALNMSSGDLQNLYDGYLTHRGLNINPMRYSGTYLAADEGLRELKQGTSIGNPQVTVPVEPTAVSQDSIEWRDRRLDEQARQRAAELEVAGVDPRSAIQQARAEFQEKAFKQSQLFDTAQSIGSKLQTIKEARKGPTVVDANPKPKVKALPTPDRKALKALAIAGLAAPSVFGSAASAAESVGRTQVARKSGNPIDWAQAGLAYASSAGDAAGYTGVGAVPGEILSTVADGANVLIDSARQPAPRPTYVPTQARVQARAATATAARKQGQMMPKPAAKPLNVVNEANYFIINPIKNALKSVFGNREI